MKITKRQLRRIIKEEKRKLLKEITPGAAGIAAMGGGTPADQGFAAAAAEEPRKTARRAQAPFPGALEDQMMDMLEEYITRLVESGDVGVIEVETLLNHLVSRAIDIAVMEGVIK